MTSLIFAVISLELSETVGQGCIVLNDTVYLLGRSFYGGDVNLKVLTLPLNEPWRLTKEGMAPFKVSYVSDSLKDIELVYRLAPVWVKPKRLYFLSDRFIFQDKSPQLMELDTETNTVSSVVSIPEPSSLLLELSGTIKLVEYMIMRNEARNNHYIITGTFSIRNNSTIYNVLLTYEYNALTKEFKLITSISGAFSFTSYSVYKDMIYLTYSNINYGVYHSVGDVFVISISDGSYTRKVTQGVKPYSKSTRNYVQEGNMVFFYTGSMYQVELRDAREFIYMLDIDTLTWTRDRPEEHCYPRHRSYLVYYKGFIINSFGTIREEKEIKPVFIDTTEIIDTFYWKKLNSLQRFKPDLNKSVTNSTPDINQTKNEYYINEIITSLTIGLIIIAISCLVYRLFEYSQKEVLVLPIPILDPIHISYKFEVPKNIDCEFESGAIDFFDDYIHQPITGNWHDYMSKASELSKGNSKSISTSFVTLFKI